MTGMEDFKAPEAAQLHRIRLDGETKPVELCEALNPSWSYVQGQNHRDADWAWQRLAFCGEKKINYLLCAGPVGDGSVEPGDVRTLTEIGRRLHQHGWPRGAEKLEGPIKKPKPL